MPFVACPNPADEAIRNLPVCSVDMGFSPLATVGIATSNHLINNEFHFSVGKGLIIEWVNQHPACVLLLEAPLSGAFTEEGPCMRHLERARNYAQPNRPRHPYPWYLNSGAAMSIATVHFFHGLPVNFPNMVYLVESYYPNVGNPPPQPRHLNVAIELLTAFVGGQALIAPLSAEPNGAMQVLPGLSSHFTTIPPVVLRPGLVLNPPA